MHLSDDDVLDIVKGLGHGWAYSDAPYAPGVVRFLEVISPVHHPQTWLYLYECCDSTIREIAIKETKDRNSTQVIVGFDFVQSPSLQQLLAVVRYLNMQIPIEYRAWVCEPTKDQRDNLQELCRLYDIIHCLYDAKLLELKPTTESIKGDA